MTSVSFLTTLVTDVFPPPVGAAVLVRDQVAPQLLVDLPSCGNERPLFQLSEVTIAVLGDKMTEFSAEVGRRTGRSVFVLTHGPLLPTPPS